MLRELERIEVARFSRATSHCNSWSQLDANTRGVRIAFVLSLHALQACRAARARRPNAR